MALRVWLHCDTERGVEGRWQNVKGREPLTLRNFADLHFFFPPKRASMTCSKHRIYQPVAHNLTSLIRQKAHLKFRPPPKEIIDLGHDWSAINKPEGKDAFY